MKKRNNILVLVLILAMVLMTACKSKNDGASPSDNETASSPGADKETTGTPSVLKDGKDTELVVVYPGSSSAPADLQAVQDAINVKVKEKMDAHVTLKIIEWGAMMDQYNLMLSSNEKIDLLFGVQIANYITKGQLQPITDLVQEYAPDALAAMGDFTDACYMGGELYGLPTFHNLALGSGFVARKDIIDDLGLDISTVQNWDDMEEIFAEVKAAYPDMNLMVPGNVSYGVLNGIILSQLDEIQSGVGISYSSADAKVVNIYATEEYKEICRRAYDWNQKGYFLPDAAINTETRNSLISAGNAFGYIVSTMYPGFITQESNNNGKEMVGVNIGSSILTTSNVSMAQWTVPTACENPEKALAFLNLLYSDPDIQNLFFYGVEGLDYQVKDAEQGVIGFLDGQDGSTVGYTNQAWITGNAAIAHTWETDSPTIWADLTEFNNSAKKSSLYGFTYDASKIRNEITAITNVKNKYCAILESGMADVDETLEKFNSELESAGIQNVIDDMQTQIDAWVKSK